MELYENKALELFDEYLDNYGDIEVCGLSYSASKVLKAVDETAYREQFNNWADAEEYEIV